jgi:hypothetical protein
MPDTAAAAALTEARAVLARFKDRNYDTLDDGRGWNEADVADLTGSAGCLLAAAEAVLELPAEWDARAQALWVQIAAEPDAGAVRAGLMGCTASGYQACARALREAITAKLLAEET